MDLCAAPGSWSQVIRKRLYEHATNVQPLIVAVDLQEMAPIPGVSVLRGDISTLETVQDILAQFGGQQAELVVCDGAPDVTGMHDVDEHLQHRLLLAALRITLLVLEEGGTFVAKVFRGRHIGWLTTQLFVFFETVHCVKPASSRGSSLESFVVCQGLRRPKGFDVALTDNFMKFENALMRLLGPREKYKLAPFVSAGSLQEEGDSDRTYFLPKNHVPLDPVQPPLSAAYLKAFEIAAGKVKPI